MYYSPVTSYGSVFVYAQLFIVEFAFDDVYDISEDMSMCG